MKTIWNKLMKPQKGQAMTEALIPLMILGVIAFAILAFVANSPAKPAPSFWVDPQSPEHENTHIDEKDAALVAAVNECISKGGTLQEVINPETQRHAKVCQLPTGTYCVKVEEANGCPVTIFAKEKMKTLSQVLKNLFNRGYKVTE